MNDTYKEIFKKQCEIAGVDFATLDFKNSDWFTDNTWTQEQEDTFKEWLKSWLRADKKRLAEVAKFPNLMNDKRLKGLVSEWILNYGFKTVG